MDNNLRSDREDEEFDAHPPEGGLMSNLSEQQRDDVKTAAHHEAAHAVIGLINGFEIQRIDISKAWMGDGGQCSWGGKDEELTADYCERLILRAAAGRAAEKHLGVEHNELTYQLFQCDDDKIAVCAAQIARSCNGDAEKIADRLREKASELVDLYWNDIENLANRLCFSFYLNQEQIKQISFSSNSIMILGPKKKVLPTHQ